MISEIRIKSNRGKNRQIKTITSFWKGVKSNHAMKQNASSQNVQNSIQIKSNHGGLRSPSNQIKSWFDLANQIKSLLIKATSIDRYFCRPEDSFATKLLRNVRFSSRANVLANSPFHKFSSTKYPHFFQLSRLQWFDLWFDLIFNLGNHCQSCFVYLGRSFAGLVSPCPLRLRTTWSCLVITCWL